jgi:hypothetical protein
MSREIRAQALLLESLLTHQPLPGMTQLLAMPDVAFEDDNSQIILLDDRSSSELDFPPRVRLMSQAELQTLGPESPPQFFEFLPPEQFPGKISVRLRLSVLFPGHGLVPGGEIVATFFDRDPLTATDPTHVMAY